MILRRWWPRSFGSSTWWRVSAAAVLAAVIPLCLLEAIRDPAASSRSAPPREVRVSQDTFGAVTVFAPPRAGDLRAFVIYLYDDSDGGVEAPLSPSRRASVEHLVGRGAAVAPLRARAVLDLLAKHADTDTKCFYALGEFESLSTLGQRALGGTTYRWPLLLGDGTIGGTLAYLALAQAPANTVAGAVSLALDTVLTSALPLCPGTPWTREGPDRFAYAPSADLPGPWVLVAPGGEQAPPPEVVQAFVRADPGNVLRVPEGSGDEAARLRAGEDAALEIGAPPQTSIADLPLVELPARTLGGEGGAGAAGQRPQALAIFLSGDGGWRDIDKAIAEELAVKGIGIVGVDALRYFWDRKSPETLARDLERIAEVYGQRWKPQRLALIGYSMGADVLPFAWEYLGAATRDRVQLIGLIGLETTVAFEISIAGFVGVDSAQDVDVRPALRTLPAERVLCVFGTQEKADGDTGCTLPEIRGASLLERPGGHHLDGNYELVARAIIDRLK